MKIDRDERRNFLRRCWADGRWTEAGLELIRPARFAVYDLRRRFTLRDRRPTPDSAPRRAETQVELGPNPFARRDWSLPAVDAGEQERLRAETDGHLANHYRLAGAGRHRITDPSSSHFADPEDRHSYHRLYWAARLARAAATRIPGAEECLDAQLRQWLAADWSSDTAISTPYTSSERVLSVVDILYWIARGRLIGLKGLEPLLLARMLGDASHVCRRIERGLGWHNHVLTNARALMWASKVLAGQPEAPAWARLSNDVFREVFPHLVLDDGSFAEGSSTYGIMNARTVLDVLVADRKGRVDLGDLRVRLVRSLEYANWLLRPDGTVPKFGDISPDVITEELWGTLVAAYHLGFMRAAPRHPVATLTTAFHLADEPSPLPPTQQPRPTVYHDGGWAFLPSPAGGEVAVHADPRPRTGTHGDAGRGSFELWWNGFLAVRDPGCPSYSLHSRHWYRSGDAQNVSCLRGLAPGISEESQDLLPSWYTDVQNSELTLVDGTLRFRSWGYERLGASVVLEREWAWASPSQLLMKETIAGTLHVPFSSSFHIGDGPWQSLEAGCRCRYGPDGRSVVMVVEAPDGARVRLARSTFCPEYGVERTGSRLVVEGRVRLPIEWTVTWTFS